MRVVVIVVVAPGVDQVTGMAQAHKQVLVQALIPKAAIEALHEAVLHRFAGRDVVPVDAGVLAPSEHGHTGQFRAVVADNRSGP